MPAPTDETAVRDDAAEPGHAGAREAPAGASEGEETLPPAVIVRLRAPDHAVARIIGEMTPEQARLGAAVTFGVSPQGRRAERAGLAGAATPAPHANTLALPHPRRMPPPTRVATSSFDRDPEAE